MSVTHILLGLGAMVCRLLLIARATGSMTTSGFHLDSALTGYRCRQPVMNFGKRMNAISCASACSSERTCDSLFYNVADKTCVGVTGRIRNSTGCLADSSMKYYITGTANNEPHATDVSSPTTIASSVASSYSTPSLTTGTRLTSIISPTAVVSRAPSSSPPAASVRQLSCSSSGGISTSYSPSVTVLPTQELTSVAVTTSVAAPPVSRPANTALTPAPGRASTQPTLTSTTLLVATPTSTINAPSVPSSTTSESAHSMATQSSTVSFSSASVTPAASHIASVYQAMTSPSIPFVYPPMSPSVTNPSPPDGSSMTPPGTVYGAACSETRDCSMANTACLDRTCQCTSHVRYNPQTGVCVYDCQDYGNTYIVFTDRVLSVTNLEEYSHVSLTECKESCQQTRRCRGFSFYNEVCHLKERSPHTDSTSFQYHVGVTYYARNCAA